MTFLAGNLTHIQPELPKGVYSPSFQEYEPQPFSQIITATPRWGIGHETVRFPQRGIGFFCFAKNARAIHWAWQPDERHF